MVNKNELHLSKVILGSMGFSEPAHAADISTIHAAIERGVTSIDTAPLYGAGESERIVGRAVADRRANVQLLTKCGLRWDDEHGQPLFTVEINGQPWTPRKNSRPSSIMIEIERCLERLQTDYIDLMQIHHLDPDTPVDETMEALLQARDQGKIREIGVSNYPLEKLHSAFNSLSGELFSTQNQLSLLQQKKEHPTLDFCKEKGVRFLAYSPLAQGVLGGRLLNEKPVADWRASGPYRHPKNVERINAVLNQVAMPMAREHGVSLAQLALLWVLDAQGANAVIAGGRKKEQILDAAGTLTAKVPKADLDRLAQAIARCGFSENPGVSLAGKGVRFLQRGKGAIGRRIRQLL